MRGKHTWQEITSQSQIWEKTLHHFEKQRQTVENFPNQTPFERLLVIGCGSTHYLAQSAATTLTRYAGIPALACPSSELWLYADHMPVEETGLLAISRSGTTTETLRAVNRFQKTAGGPVIAITCSLSSTLAQQADLVISAPHAQEVSVAQTRSFTSMLLLSQALTAVLGEDHHMLQHLHHLPEALARMLDRAGDLPRQLGEDLQIERLFFLGGGPLYGLANEAMLKTKEMSLSFAEAYHPMEFRHGPMSMVNEQTLVVGFVSDTGETNEIRLLHDMAQLGARTLALIQDASAFVSWHPDHVIELQSGLNEWQRGALYLPVVQCLAYHRAIAKGLDPDKPHNLSAVIEL